MPEKPARRNVSVFGGTLVTGGAMIVRQGLAVVISVIIARGIGADGKGSVALISQYAGVTALMAGLGFEGAHAYFVGRRGRPADQAVADSIAFIAVSGPIAAASVWAFMWFGVPALDTVSGAVLLLGAVAVVPLLLTSLLTGVLVGEGMVREQAFATVVVSVVSFAVIVAMQLTGRLTVLTALAGTLVGLIAGAAVILGNLRIRSLPRPSLKRMREEVSYAWRNYVQNIAGFLELRQDVLLLGFLSSSAAVGVYTTGVSLGELIYMVPQAVVVALTSRVLREAHASGVELTTAVTRLLFSFSMLLALLLAVVARPLVLLAFGPEFVDSALVFWLLLPGILSWALASQAQTFLAAHGQLFPGLALIMVAINLVLNLLLIPVFGIYGAALASSISYCIGNGYVAWVFTRQSRTRLIDLVVIRADDVRLLRAAVDSRLSSRR